jgi:hypothetical protein
MGHGPNAASVTPGGPEGFGAPWAYAVRQAIVGDLAVVDVDEDGSLDLLGAGSTSVEVLFGRG